MTGVLQNRFVHEKNGRISAKGGTPSSSGRRFQKLAQVHRVTLGILPSEVQKNNQAATLAKSAPSFTEKQNASRTKEPRRVEEKAHQPQQSTSTSWVVCLKHSTANMYINIAEGPKILEVQAAFSIHARRVTFQENSGKKRTIGGSNPTRASSRAVSVLHNFENRTQEDT